MSKVDIPSFSKAPKIKPQSDAKQLRQRAVVRGSETWEGPCSPEVEVDLAEVEIPRARPVEPLPDFETQVRMAKRRREVILKS